MLMCEITFMDVACGVSISVSHHYPGGFGNSNPAWLLALPLVSPEPRGSSDKVQGDPGLLFMYLTPLSMAPFRVTMIPVSFESPWSDLELQSGINTRSPTHLDHCKAAATYIQM